MPGARRVFRLVAVDPLLLLVPLVVVAPAIGIGVYLLGAALRWRAYYQHKGVEAPALPVGAFVRYALGEGVAMVTLMWWRVRAALADALREPEGPVSGPPVLCVHGITQNGTNFLRLRRTLERRGRPTRAVSLGVPGRPLAAYVPPLERALRELIAVAPGGTVDVVAHSMGGVVLRMALAAHPDLAPHLRRIVTVASPHAGTAAGRGFPIAGAVRSLGRRSPLLQDLPGFPSSAHLTTIAARHDLIVYPQETCHLPGARTIELDDVGHVGLLTRRAAVTRIVEAVCDDEPAAIVSPA